MAVVNDKYNFIFFHLYKCGGTSVRKLLDNYEGTKSIIGGHTLPEDVKTHYYVRGKKYQDKFDSMFKFTVVRNPFDFLLSVYHYAKLYETHFWHKEVEFMDFQDFPIFYLNKIEESKRTRTHGRNEIVTLYQFITDKNNKVIVDYIAKLENIDNDMNIILNKIGVPNIIMPKTNVNPANAKSYQEVYTDKTRDFVEKHFRKDLEYFEYEF